MPIEVLTIGGTGFIGNRLVSELLAQGHRVTVASRDRKARNFGRSVVWRQVDRRKEDQLRSLICAQRWDLIYDLACFDRTDAQIMAKAIGNNVGRYIMISSASVYPYGERLKEVDFPPPLLERLGEGSGKRGAEAAVYQTIRVPSAIVRLPFVLGMCDPLERIQYYVRRSRQRQNVSVPNVSARFSLLTVEEAARFLAWLGSTEFEGSINGAFEASISLPELIELVNNVTGGDAKASATKLAKPASPLGLPQSLVLDVAKATRAGYYFGEMRDTLRASIEKSFAIVMSY